MRHLLLTMLLAGIVCGQSVVLDDYTCTLSTQAEPYVYARQGGGTTQMTKITCKDSPHKMETLRAWSGVHLGSATDGDTLTIDGITYIFKSALSGTPGANEILLGPDNTTRIHYAIKAINDTGDASEKGVIYSSNISAHPTVEAGILGSSVLTITAKVGGTAGDNIVLSVSNPSHLILEEDAQNSAYRHNSSSSTLNLNQSWYATISEATGEWAAINQVWVAWAYDANSFLIPFNSSLLGSFGGKLEIARASFQKAPMFYSGNENSVYGADYFMDGHWVVPVFACTNPDDGYNCSKGFWTTDNQKGYLDGQSIQSFVVKDKIATIILQAPFLGGNGYPDIAVGQPVWVRGYQAYYTDSNPGIDGGVTANYPAQAGAKGMSMDKSSGAVTPHGSWTRTFKVLSYDKTSDPSHPVLTIGGVDLVDGTYVGSCAGGACYPGGAVDPSAAIVSTTWPASPYVWFNPRTTGGYTYPMGFMAGNVKGTFDKTMNRLSFWVKNDKDLPITPRGDLMWGTYVTTASTPYEKSSHFYNHIQAAAYKGVWQKFEFTSAPDHEVGGNTGVFPNNPSLGHDYYPYWAGGPRTFMDGQINWYLNWDTFLDDRSGQVYYISPFTLDKITDEPMEYVRSRSSQFSPRRYDVHGALQSGPGYEVGWEGPILAAGAVQYEVRRSASGSLKALGFSSGICNDGSSTCTAANGDIIGQAGRADNYPGTYWRSNTVSVEDPELWVGIRPIVPIHGVSGAGQDPIYVTLESSLDLQAGGHVKITGVTGNAAANWTDVAVTSVHPRQLWFLHQPSSNSTWTGSGALNGITCTGYPSTLCTVSLNVPHNLVAGMYVQVFGSNNSALGAQPADHGSIYRVTSVVDPDTFVLSTPNVPNGTYNTDGSGVHLVAMSLPALTVPSNGATADWTGGGTIQATDEHKNFAEVHITPYVVSTAAPASPSGVVASVVSTSQIDVSWTGSGGWYDLERRVSPAGQWTKIYSGRAPVYSDTKLQSSTVYGYRVQECNVGGCSEVTSEVTAGTGNAPAPSGNVTVRIGGLATSRAVILLYAAPDSRSCTVSVNSVDYTDLGGIRARIQVVDGLSEGTEYGFSLSCGNGAATTAGTFRTAPQSTPATRIVAVSANPPGLTASIDNLVVDYGASSDLLTQSVSTSCASGRCRIQFGYPSDSTVWIRRRWCKAGAIDPLCAKPNNEMARSAAEPVPVR